MSNFNKLLIDSIVCLVLVIIAGVGVVLSQPSIVVICAILNVSLAVKLVLQARRERLNNE